jgi:hypothetical protein
LEVEGGAGGEREEEQEAEELEELEEQEEQEEEGKQERSRRRTRRRGEGTTPAESYTKENAPMEHRWPARLLTSALAGEKGKFLFAYQQIDKENLNVRHHNILLFALGQVWNGSGRL